MLTSLSPLKEAVGPYYIDGVGAYQLLYVIQMSR